MKNTIQYGYLYIFNSDTSSTNPSDRLKYNFFDPLMKKISLELAENVSELVDRTEILGYL